MEKAKMKICDHYNKRKLNDFEKKAMARSVMCCDSCFPTIPKKFDKDAEGMLVENLLMCLSCFYVGCNRQTKKQCMLNHGEKNQHHLTYSLSLGAIWCYLCDYELKEFLISQNRDDNTEKYNEKLDKLQEYVKQVDTKFQALIRKRQEEKFKEENQIEEEEKNDSSSEDKVEKDNLNRRTSKGKILILIKRTCTYQTSSFWIK
jgi:uncharacterized UBP type Zn finger protein